MLKEKKSGGAGVFTAVATIIAITAVIFIFAFGERGSGVSVTDGVIEISGMYGVTVPLDEIVSITLIDKTMKEIGVGTRRNGYGGLGPTLKGNFVNPNALLFVHSTSSPTIRIERENDKDIYISFKDSAKTREVYELIS